MRRFGGGVETGDALFKLSEGRRVLARPLVVGLDRDGVESIGEAIMGIDVAGHLDQGARRLGFERLDFETPCFVRANEGPARNDDRGGCALCHFSSRLPVEETGDEVVDTLRKLSFHKSAAHKRPCALKFDALRQLDGGCNFFCLQRSSRQRDVRLIFRIKTRNWEVENHFIEVPRSPLASRLIRFDPFARRFAIYDGAEVGCFLFRYNWTPIK
jgi:hypothetical protein